MNIQDEVSKIHAQFGVSELANYKIQILFDKHGNEQYNQALEDAAEKVQIKSVNEYQGEEFKYLTIDKQSILSLKKSVSSTN